MLFICYPKCSTCQKAKKWLDGHNIEYTERHIVEDNPTYDELKVWYEKSGLPLKKFFNTSGLLYKEMQLKDKLPAKAETVEATEPKPKKDHKILKAIGFGAIAALAGVGGYFIGKGRNSGSDDDYVDANYEEYSTEETEE